MRAFLTAEWRYIVMLNYRVDPAILAPFVPRGTELDLFEGSTYISLVGFQFLRTRVLGVPVPLHRDFEEVNLRFYVRRAGSGELRRGVCFIQEIVPRWAVSTVARLAYNENYRTLPMSHSLEATEAGVRAGYSWRLGQTWNHIDARAEGNPELLREGSLEQFIAEHYWGYCVQRNGSSIEYRVEHSPWRVWSACKGQFEGDPGALYGPVFGDALSGSPDSAFLAEGSPVTVRVPTRIR